MKNKFKGVGVALITPFTATKEVDFAAIKHLINHIVNNGVNFVVVLGTTGEAATLSRKERQEVFDCVLAAVAQRIPVVAGFGGNNTQAMINEFSQYNYSQFDAILSASPHYNKPNQTGIFQHYQALATRTPVPIILYNVPSRTAANISAATTLRLAHQFKNIVAIKEASGDIMQCMNIANGLERTDFALLSGDDAIALPLASIGFHGVISVIGNAFPSILSTMMQQALQGNFSAAKQQHYNLLKMMQLLFEDGNPAGIKAALHALKLCENELRLPLVIANELVQESIAKEVNVLRNKKQENIVKI